MHKENDIYIYIKQKIRFIVKIKKIVYKPPTVDVRKGELAFPSRFFNQ
jgi:hypothetical protein